MLTLLHGDNVVVSRKALTDAVATAKSGGLVVRLDAKPLTFSQLSDTLGAQDLFCQKKTVVIEGLLSLPKGKRKDEMVALCANSNQDIILWEGKSATPAQLKKLLKAKVLLFRTSPAVFAWLDSIRPGNVGSSQEFFKRAVEQDGAEMCFAMLVRQVRLLLQTREGVQVKASPFVVVKLRKQATFFTTDQLLRLHEKLTLLDYAVKTSQQASDLAMNMTLLLLELGRN